MAQPVEFPEQNCVFGKPPSMTDEQCVALPAHKSPEQIISCWELSDEEIEMLIKTKRVYLSVIGGVQPPVAIVVDPPFIYEDKV